MAARRVTEPLVIVLFSLILSLAIFSTVFLIGRSTDTARASTGDLGAWANTAPLTNQLWAFAAAASPSYVYISGGEVPTGSVNLTTTQRAAINSDGSLGPWQEQTPLSTARIDHGMVYTETATGNRCLYVVGGYVTQGETVTTSVEYATVGLDGASSAWASTSFMNTPRAHFGLAAYNGRLYAVGGSTTSVEFTSINNDCTLASPWQNTTVLTSTRFGNRAFAANGFLYNTGDISDTLSNGVQYALINPNNGTIGSWTATNAMNQKRADHTVLADTRAGYAYVLGGVSPTSTQTASVERASLTPDGTLGSWATMASLPAPLEDMAFAQANGRVYMLGGRSGSITNTVLFSTIEGAGLPNLSTSAKRVGSSGASPGQAITYTIVLTNTGTGGASAQVTDTLPVSVTYVPGSATGEAAYVSATRAITWSGVVAAGSAVTISYSGVITSPLDNGTVITNTASINDGASAPFETAPVTTTISSAPNLSTSTKLVNMAVVTPGQTITYTVFLTNTGNMNASARLTDTLPVSVTYVSGSATGGAAYNSGSRSITWAGSATTASPISITYRAAITSPLDNGTLITNTFTINDGFNASFDILPVTTTISSAPDLSTSMKTVKRPISSPGGTVSYNMVVSNTGTMNTSARVTDTLPLSLTYVANTLQSTMGASTYDSGNGSIYWAGPALVGLPVTISYQAKVLSTLASGTLVTNTATVQGAGETSRATSPVTVTVASNPSRIGWQNLGLFGVRVLDLGADPANGVVYLANGGSTGVYRSVNGGETWLPSNDFSNCARLMLDSSTGTVYVSCAPPNRSGIWKSADSGQTWTPILNPTLVSGFTDRRMAGAVAFAGTTLVAGNEKGAVWRSTDGGVTWTQRVLPQSSDVIAVDVDATSTQVIYAATSTKAFKSPDGGASWVEITPSGSSGDFHSIAVSPNNSSAVYIGTGVDGGNRLYKSNDSGQTWTSVSPGGSFWWIEFHPTDANTLFTQHMRSTDGGATWAGFDAKGEGLAINPSNPNVVYAGSTQGVHKSTDGGTTWREVNTGLEEVRVDDVAQNPRDTNAFLIASPMGLGNTFDNGANWTWPVDLSSLPQPDMGPTAVAIEPTESYMSGGISILGRSADNGRTWSTGNLQQVVQNDLGASTGGGVGEIGLVPGETGHLFAAVRESPEGRPTPKGGVYESTDAGLTWTATGMPRVPVNAISFGKTAAGTIIYAGVGDMWGKYSGAGGVYTSTVGNTAIWNQISISNTAPAITELRVDPTNALVVYAGGGFVDPADSAGRLNGTLYKTTDGGATWSYIMPTVQTRGPSGIRAIAIDSAFTNNVYFSVESKIYQTVDGGATWSLFSSNDLGGEGINALIVSLAAPSPVATFTATATNGQTVLNWTNPGDSDFAGVLVKYSTQGFPMLSTEGITLTTASGLAGASGVYTQTGVVTGTTYYYSAFAYNSAGRYSLPFQTAANSSAAGLSNGASELRLRSSASAPRRPAAQAAAKSLYAAAGGGLFAKEIGGQTTIYLPALMKQFAPGW